MSIIKTTSNFSDCISLNGSVNSDVILIDGGTRVHNRATFICHTGYNLEGNSTVTCLETGHWSFSPPSCIIVGKYNARDLDEVSSGFARITHL